MDHLYFILFYTFYELPSHLASTLGDCRLTVSWVLPVADGLWYLKCTGTVIDTLWWLFLELECQTKKSILVVVCLKSYQLRAKFNTRNVVLPLQTNPELRKKALWKELVPVCKPG